MRALVIGQGGREHALVRALARSPSITEVLALPGSDGIAQTARCFQTDWRHTEKLVQLIQTEKIDFVIIGPEVPLVEGLADRLRSSGIAVVGPSGEAARLEGSKIFCKDFLREAGIPTAAAKTVSSVDETLAAAHAFRPPYVLKADGLAAGKGVFICRTLADLESAATDLFVDRNLGVAGERALLEQFHSGFEISSIVLTDGERFAPLPLAQDHKRIFDGDRGPNTGGMGVIAPISLPQKLSAQIDREIFQPTMALMKKRGLIYRGALFVGLMITPEGPLVLEFNTRFGDPETQAIMPLLDGDWGQVLNQLAHGHLEALRWQDLGSCCVVLAAEGYPDDPVKDRAIGGLGSLEPERFRSEANPNAYLLHAGTRLDREHGWVTAGGRVLNAVGIGKNLAEARDRAYFQANRIGGLKMRTDIGLRALDGITSPSGG